MNRALRRPGERVADERTEALGDAGLDPLAIKGALARLAKLQEFGDIPKNTPLILD